MTPLDVLAANRLASRWTDGDYETWSALKVYIDRRVGEDVARHVRNINSRRQDHFKKMVPDIHNYLLDNGKLNPLSMSSFTEYCSRATRHILVEITKREKRARQREPSPWES